MLVRSRNTAVPCRLAVSRVVVTCVCPLKQRRNPGTRSRLSPGAPGGELCKASVVQVRGEVEADGSETRERVRNGRGCEEKLEKLQMKDKFTW